MSSTNRPKRSKIKIESGIHGKHYERKILAFIALKCILDEDIVDFWLLSNLQEVEKFDDIILFTEHKNGDTKLFMIQVKHKDKDKKRPVAAEKLDGEDKQLGLKVYQEAYLKIKEDTEFKKIHEVPDGTAMFFILFNNCEFNPGILNDNIGFDSNHTNCFKFIDTSSDPKGVLRITNKTSKYNTQFLSEFYFYTQQKDEDLIIGEICKLLGMNNETIKSILDFFYKWVEPEDKYSMKLWRLDIKIKLLNTIFGDFDPPRTVQNTKETKILQMLSKFHVTVINQENSTLRIWNEILYEIEQHFKCSINFSSWEESIPDNILDKLTCYLKTEDSFIMNSKNITVKLLYLFLVALCKIPFYVKTTNKLFDSLKSKLIHPLGIYVIIFKVDKEEQICFDGINVFQNFADINEHTYLTQSRKLTISFQGKSDVDLYELIKNKNTIKTNISTDTCFELLYKKCVIGKPHQLPEYYVNRQIKVPLLEINVLKENEFTFIIFEFPKQSKIKGCKHMHLENYTDIILEEILEKPYNVFTVFEQLNNSFIKLLDKPFKDRTYYILKYIDPNTLTLICTNGSIDPLRPYIYYDLRKDIELIDMYSSFNVNIICNNAGMGKSMILNFINSKLSSDEWVIHINLKECSSQIRKLKTVEEIINFSYNCQSRSIDESSHDFIKLMYNDMKHKVIWLIDDYEEVNEPNLLELLKAASNLGFRLWIVTRPYLKSKFENIFKVPSMELENFTEEDQTIFIKKYLKEKGKDVESIKKNLLDISNMKHLLEGSFIGICQQTMMLTEIFLKYEHFWGEHEWYIHDIYENFLKLKVKDTKYYEVHEDWYIRTISKLALKVFFKDDALKNVFDLEEFKEDISIFKSNHRKDFFITEFIEDDVPLFSHMTYAEFFAARWLSHTLEKQISGVTPFNISNILRLLYLKELTNVRLFFDCIVTKTLPIHSAIVNKESENKIKRLVNEHSLKTDPLDRSVFHLLCSYGSYFDLGISQENKKLIRNLDTHTEIVHHDEYIHLMPVESTKSNELVKTDERNVNIIQEISKRYLDCVIGMMKKKSIQDLDAMECALMSGSLMELNSLLQIRNVALCCSLSVSEDIKFPLLFHSIQNKWNNILNLLVVKGLTNVKIGLHKRNLLHVAVVSKNLEAVKKLTSEHPLDEWEMDENGNTPLHIACNQKDNSMIEYFFSLDINVDYLNKQNSKGQSHLYFLARRGHKKYIAEIIRKFPDIQIDCECSFGNTPFIISVIFGNLKVTKLLHSKKANVNHKNNRKMTALHYAASKGSIKIAKQLVAWKVSINCKDGYGMTPLMKASKWGHKDVAKLLLAKKANVKLTDQNQWTALHHAVRRNHLEIIHLLLEVKADVNSKNKSHETPIDVACKHNFPQALKVLLSKDGINHISDKSLGLVFVKNYVECADLLLQSLDGQS